MISKKLRTVYILSIVLMVTVFPFIGINSLYTSNITEHDLSTDTQYECHHNYILSNDINFYRDIEFLIHFKCQCYSV